MELTELVIAASEVDVEAFTELVCRYQGMVYGHAYARLGDVHLAEDAAQQTFIAAYRSLASLDQPERFGGWLRGIARFQCSRIVRSRRVAHVPLDAAQGICASAPGPDQMVEDGDGLDRVLLAILALPLREREPTILFYVHGLSQREVADLLDVTIANVNNRLRNARKRLTEGELAMAGAELKRHGLPDDFAENIGRIVRSDGTVVDARFDNDRRPPVLNALTISEPTSTRTLVVEVTQHLDDGLVRCLTRSELGSPVLNLRSGMKVADTGGPVEAPLDTATMRRFIASRRRSSGRIRLQETGIKSIDVLCPLPAGGVIGLVGDMQSGKMVLVEELIHRLSGSPAPLSIVVFVESPVEVSVIQSVEYRTSDAVEAIYLPVPDASLAALAAVTVHLDAILSFSHLLAKDHLYPAIDPLRSSSRLLDPATIGHGHFDVALDVLRYLERARSDRDRAHPPVDETVSHRANLLQRFLTQPFFVAEAFTDKPGRTVPREAAVAGCRALMAGTHDHLSEDTLTMIGALEQAFAQ